MFGKKSHKRGSNPIFILFRLALSLTMFTLLFWGGYSAYKHFSGLDPLKLDPQAVLNEVLGSKNPQELISNLGKSTTKITQDNIKIENIAKPIQPQGKLVFKFMVFADSHNDNNNLRRAINQTKQKYAEAAFIIGLGDYTEVGTAEEFVKTKNELDNSGLRYFLIPGDHDLWDCRNRDLPPNCNFKENFGPTYQSFTYNNFRLILLNNADNYLGMDQEQINWLTSELEQAKTDQAKGVLVFIHEPLFHPSSDHFMGRVTPSLKTQAKGLAYQLKGAGVKKVISGDIHYFSEYEEPESKLPMTTIGALTTDRNPQASRFGIVSVYEDGFVGVEDIEIR